MHEAVFRVVILWYVVLACVLAVAALRAGTIVVRALALDALVLVIVAALAVVSIRRGDPAYLDIALVLALLGFAQTVATARIAEGRRDLE